MNQHHSHLKRKRSLPLLSILALSFFATSALLADNTVTYSSTDTYTDSIALTASTTLSIDTGITATQSGSITGTSYAVTVTGADTTSSLILTSTNSYKSTTITMGNLTISGSSATITNSGNLVVGTSSGSIATLSITDGADVKASSAYVAYSADSTGSLTISGSGSTLSLSSNLYVAYYGTGDMTITDGATVKASSLTIGRYADSIGTITVSGSGSALTLSSNLIIGYSGTGDMTITDSATVTTSKIIVAYSSDSTGSLTIGGGATVYTSQIVATGSGTLVLDGATLVATSNQSSYISGFDGDNGGGVTIESGGVTFNTKSYNITISTSLSGDGALTKTGSGTLTLTGDNTYSGGTTVSTGTLSVYGGTISHDSADIIIGDTTTASMTVLSSATVTASSIILGNSTGGYGYLTVSDSTLVVGQITTGSGSGTATFDSAVIVAATDSELITSSVSTVIESGGLTINTTNGAYDYSVSISSILTGTGSLTVTGSGTVTLNAVNTYTGSTIIYSGTLSAGVANAFVNNTDYYLYGGTLDLNNYDLTVSSITGTSSSAVLSLGTATLTVSQDTDTTYAGSITGESFSDGTIIKTGTGCLTLTGDSSDGFGALYVNEGSVCIDGTVNASITVSSTLSGIGTMSGMVTVLSGGVFSPGNSTTTISTVTVGTLNLLSGSTTLIDVTGADTAGTDYDQIIITGTATLGGTLKLVLSGYTLKAGDSFTILTGTSDYNGSFSSIISSLNNALTFSTTVSDSDYIVTVSQGSFVPFATNANQRAVASALDTEAAASKMSTLIDKLNTISGSSLPAAYQQIAPDELGAMGKMAFQFGHVQIRNVEGRVDAARTGLGGFSMAGLSLYDKDGAVDLEHNALLADSGSVGRLGLNRDKYTTPSKNNPWGLFLTGSGQFGSLDGTSDYDGYDINTAGITFGVDYRLSENTIVGFMIGYQNGEASLDDGGKIKTNGVKVGPYAGWFQDNWYANATLNGGFSSYDTKRNVLDETQNGSTNGTEFTGAIGGGYDIKRGNLTFGPTASFEYNYAGIDSYSESGGLAPLTISSQDYSSFTSRFGGRVAYLWKLQRFWIRPEFHLAWQHEFLNTSESINARFVDGSGSMFSVKTADTGADSAIVGGSIDLSISETFGTYLSFEDEINSDYNIGTIFGGLRYNF
jgi:T5SS/PEP-CTERM-associated repeat protein/autotransporter-associated beta strand protein